jgi:clan AA aspartic protease (TIGR02281 family)
VKANSALFIIATLLIVGFIAYYFIEPFPETRIEEPQTNKDNERYDGLQAQAVQQPAPGSDPKVNTGNRPDVPLQQPSPAPAPATSPTPDPTDIAVHFDARPEQPNIKYVDIEINGVPVKAILDTGASGLCINRQTALQLGLTNLQTARLVNTAGGNTTAYPFTASSVKIGTLTLNNIQGTYIPTSRENLLGGTFLKNFTYTVDEQNQVIHFKPNNNNYQLQEEDPRSIDGSAQINGKTYIISNGHLYEQQ